MRPLYRLFSISIAKFRRLFWALYSKCPSHCFDNYFQISALLCSSISFLDKENYLQDGVMWSWRQTDTQTQVLASAFSSSVDPIPNSSNSSVSHCFLLSSPICQCNYFRNLQRFFFPSFLILIILTLSKNCKSKSQRSHYKAHF